MEHLFLNFDADLRSTTVRVLSTLGLDGGVVVESENVYSGEYGVCRANGLMLKLEENSYDYEDQFRYMLAIKPDVMDASPAPDTEIGRYGEWAQGLLCEQLQTPVGREILGDVVTIYPKDLP